MKRLRMMVLLCVVTLAMAEDPIPMTWRAVDLPGCGVTVSAISICPSTSERVLIGTESAGIHYSDDGGERWQSAVGLTCFGINSIAWHPTSNDVVWAGTMNGVYVSVDAGKSWTSKSVGMPTDSISEECKYFAPVSKIIFDPKNSSHMLAFTGVPKTAMVAHAKVGNVWETTDGGSAWRHVALITENGTIQKKDDSGKTVNSRGVSISDAAFPGRIPMLVVAVSNGGGFFESVDGGVSWESKSTGLPHFGVSGLTTFPNRMDTFLVHLGKGSTEIGETEVKPGGIFKTISGGLGWFSISKELPTVRDSKEHHVTGYQAFAMAPSKPSVMYTCDGSFKSGVIFKSVNGGKTWTGLATQKHFGQDQTEEQKALHHVETFFSIGLSHLNVMSVDPKNPDVVYAGGDSTLIRSKDGGKTWTDLTAKKGADGTWAGTGLGLIDATCLGFDPEEDGRIIITGKGVAKVLETLDGGKSWRLHGNDVFPWGGGNAVAFSKRRAYVGTGQFGIFGSIVTSLGTSWKTISDTASKLPSIKRCAQVSDVHVDSVRFNCVYAIIGGRVYRSTNFGRTWGKILDRRDLVHIAGIPGKADGFFVSGSSSCFVHMGSNRFRPIGGPKDGGKIICDSKGRLYLASGESARSGLWRYDGKTWDRLFDEGYVADVAIDPKRPNRMALCTSDHGASAEVNATGVWLSDDGGKHWTAVNAGLSMTIGDTIAFNPRDTSELWFSTNGGGTYVLTWPDTYELGRDRAYASTVEDRKFCVYSANKRPGFMANKGGGVTSPLRNGDMEQGTSQATYWSNRWTGRGRVVVARDVMDAYEGEASLRIQAVGGQAKGQIAQVMTAGNITQVSVVAYVKTEGKISAQVSVQAFDSSWKTLKYHTVKHFRKVDKWTRIQGTVKLPPGTARFGLGLLIEGSGKAWLDDVQLTVK